MERIICLLIGYAFGLIQTGYIVGKAKGIDIRDYGSKNAGTTNVLRTLGAKYGALVLLGDAFKCMIAVLVVKLIYANIRPDILCLLMLYAAAGVILGHNFPFYLHFRGGKGIAATAGLVFSYCYQVKHGWIVPLVSMLFFFTLFFILHYVSVSSMASYIVVFIITVILGEKGAYGFPAELNRTLLTEYYIVMGLLTVMAVYRHKENIKRLIAGNERKTYLKGKPEIDVDKHSKE